MLVWYQGLGLKISYFGKSVNSQHIELLGRIPRMVPPHVTVMVGVGMVGIALPPSFRVCCRVAGFPVPSEVLTVILTGRG